MVDRSGEFNFFQGIHVRIDIRIDISIFIRPMTTKFGKEVHLDELTKVRLMTHGLVTHVITSRSRDKLKRISTSRVTFHYETPQNGNLP